jgi:hypothetical protein
MHLHMGCHAALVGLFGTPGLQLGHGIPYAIAETQAA